MNTQVMNVTPEMAKKWLGQNSGNRNLRASRVASFVSDMQDGNWKLTHQGIAIDKDGNLLDGQHRLTAIVKSGITVPMLVSTDVDRDDTLLAIDTGAIRSVPDVLKFRHGDERIYRRDSVAILRMVWAFTDTIHQPMTVAQVDRAIHANQELLDYTSQLKNKSKILRSTALTTGLLAGLVWGVDRETIERFVDLAYKNIVDPFASTETNKVILDYTRSVLRVGAASATDRMRSNEMTRCAIYAYVKGLKQIRRLNIEVPYPIQFDSEFRIVRGQAVYAKTYAEDEGKAV